MSNVTATTAATGEFDDSLDPGDFERLAHMVVDRSAIVLEAGKEYLVQSRLAPVARAEGFASLHDLILAIVGNPRSQLATAVIDAITTNETSFFRDVHPFDALRNSIIPELLANRGAPGLNIWCGASSSGQEPHSLLMLLLESFPQLTPTNTRLIATDLSPTMVARCKLGQYSRLEVNRGLPARLLTRFFVPEGARWQLNADVLAFLECRVMNLMESWQDIPKCDLVMLRNVLIYFSPEVKSTILRRIRTEVLKPGGYLLLGGSETTFQLDAGYERKEFGKTLAYQVPLAK